MICDKVFKSGLSNFCGKQPLTNSTDVVCLSRAYLLKFFKDCLPLNLLSPLFNTLPHSISIKYGEALLGLFEKTLIPILKYKIILKHFYFTFLFS